MIDFPRHDCSLTLTHNGHKDAYETVAQAIDGMYRNAQWVNFEQREKAIATNECWHLVWYPDTPVGQHSVLAADLDILLEFAKTADDE
jgi:hypothetical protein